MWASGGTMVSPVSGTLLADTGALPASTITFTIAIWSETACYVSLNRRNSTNTVTLNSQRIVARGGYEAHTFTFTPALNERLTLVVDSVFYDSNSAPRIQASIIGA